MPSSVHRLQRDDHADQAAAAHIDAHRQMGAPDRPPVALIHDDQIDHRVVDLDLFQRSRSRRHRASGRLQGAGSISTFPAPRDHARMHPGDAGGHRVPRRHRQPLHLAGPGDIAVHHRETELLPLQLPGAHRLTNHRFHRLRQPPRSPATARLPGGHIRHHPRALPIPVHRHVDLTPGQTQPPTGIIRGFMGHRPHPRQRGDHRSPSARLLPRLIRPGQQARSTNGAPSGVTARTTGAADYRPTPPNGLDKVCDANQFSQRRRRGHRSRLAAQSPRRCGHSDGAPI